MPPPKKLLLEDGEEEGQLEITINEDFAKRFEVRRCWRGGAV